jgi:hypothetical protein
MSTIRQTTGAPMGCEQFEAVLPGYLEHALPPATLATAEAHRRACVDCAALALDLESIRDEAAALPVLAPTRDLWDGIEARIGAPVVALDEARHRHGAAPATAAPAVDVGRPAHWPRRPWLAAAAALLLVAGTAGVTYTVTVSRLGGERAAPVVAAGASEPGTLPAVVASAGPVVGDAPSVSLATADVPPTAPAAPAPAGPRGATLASDPAGAGAVGALEAAAVYDREIAILRGLLDERSAGLDTATVRVLETNLDIIDRAIRDSREALLRDPASPLLNRKLTDALGVKLELMRTAVLIGSSAD